MMPRSARRSGLIGQARVDSVPLTSLLGIERVESMQPAGSFAVWLSNGRIYELLSGRPAFRVPYPRPRLQSCVNRHMSITPASPSIARPRPNVLATASSPDDWL
jgi:hypothetical protein